MKDNADSCTLTAIWRPAPPRMKWPPKNGIDFFDPVFHANVDAHRMPDTPEGEKYQVFSRCFSCYWVRETPDDEKCQVFSR